jgi:hypothetical protein
MVLPLTSVMVTSSWRATWLAAVSLGLPLALGCFLAMPGLPFHPQGYLSWLSRHASDMGDGWPGFEASSRGWIHALTSTLRWGLSGAHLEILALLGMIGLWRQRSLRCTVLWFLACWWLVVGATRVQFGRYWVPVLPFLCWAAALGLRDLCLWLVPRPVRLPTWVLAVALVMVWPLVQVVRFDLALGATDTRTLAKEWLESHIPRGAQVVTLFPLWIDTNVVVGLQRDLDANSLAAVLGAGDWNLLAQALTDTSYPFVDPAHYASAAATHTRERGISTTLDALQAAGAQYYLWSSFKDGIFAEVGAEHYPERVRFLAEVERRAELIQVFDPHPGQPPDPRAPLVELETRIVQGLHAERGGPLLRIYRFRQ